MSTKILSLSAILTIMLTVFPAAATDEQSKSSSDEQMKPNILLIDTDDDMDLGEGISQKRGETDEERALRLRKIVQSATKGETTVQEAPAVITIFTEDDIHDYGFRSLLDITNYVPSFLSVNSQYDTMPIPSIMGLTQATLYVQDGINMFEPLFNVQPAQRRYPIETLKRIEIMSSPGGVLWGANSFFGVVSLITKDAEDINGVQLGIGGGTGPGDQDVFKAYGMYGKVFGNFKVFAHLSTEFYRGPKYEYLPMRLYSAPPQPLAPINYGDDLETSSFVPMNLYGVFDGKITWDKWRFTWSYPFLTLPGFNNKHISRPTTLMGWSLYTSSPVPNLRYSNVDFYDRFAALRYKDRLLNDKLGVVFKTYLTQFIRDYDPEPILPYVSGASDGVAFRAISRAYRAASSIDFDLKLGSRSTVLFGLETAYEWVKNSKFSLVAPLDEHGQLDFGAIPLVCPFRDINGDGIPVYDPNHPENTSYVNLCEQSMVFDQYRLTMSTFASFRHRFKNRVILDTGLRLQTTPAGNVSPKPILLPAFALVVPVAKNWFWKLNYLTGFRQPVFNNIGSNGRGINYAGYEDIKVEKSQAFQTELNAILIKNLGSIQEFSVRFNYSYNILDNAIKINGGRYYNSGRKYINAVEALARLYMKGGHSLFLSYSFNTMVGEGAVDGGYFRYVPNQWFSLGSMFKLSKHFDFITSLRIIGSFEDPNRVLNPANNASPASYLVLEKLPAAGILSTGFRYRTKIDRHPAELSFMIYNLTDTQNYFTGDYFGDPTASVETIPTKGQRFYFFINSKIKF